MTSVVPVTGRTPNGYKAGQLCIFTIQIGALWRACNWLVSMVPGVHSTSQ